jgi:hypothetical protein
MGWQPGAEPGPGEDPGPGGTGAARDARLAGFARDGEWDLHAPSAALAVALEGVSGTGWRCPGAERDELFGVLRRWAALESWAAAGKLGVLRALMREEDLPLPGGGHHGDLPDGWSQSLTHEVSTALAMPPRSAETLMWQAWDLQATLPGIGGLLANGTLTPAKAKAVAEALEFLSEEDKARAEAMILPELAGKTYSQAERLAVDAANTADPDSAAKRREHAERRKANVSLRRERSGAASLAGYDLPTDETLAAHAKVCARAQEYKDSGMFPDVQMDQFRARAYLDILNGVTAEARIAAGQPDFGLGARADGGPDCDPDDDADDGRDDGPGGAGPGGEPNDGPDEGGSDDEPDSGPGDVAPGGEPDRGHPNGSSSDHPDAAHPNGDGPGPIDKGSASPASPESPAAPKSSSPPAPSASLPRLADLVIPLATLLGLAWRPGEGHGLGSLDPDLCRALAATAANSPHSTLCVTVTGPEGYAIGHGCGRPTRTQRRHQSGKRTSPDTGTGTTPADRPPWALTVLPARLNLTITSTLLAELAQAAARDATGPPGPAETGSPQPREPGPWSFTRTDDAGPPGGYGSWELTLPDGRVLTVKFEPVPTYDCDHQRESHAYKPSDALRHLVQIRDYECTFPTCSRHARESDFEHAIPYHKGGRTCGCNAGARSRQCHQVKQSPGWKVTQPRPGWHQWETPSGRVYLQEPKRYPV